MYTYIYIHIIFSPIVENRFVGPPNGPVIFENHVGPDKIIWGSLHSQRRNLVGGVELHPEVRR